MKAWWAGLALLLALGAHAGEKEDLKALRQRLEKLRSDVASKEDARTRAADSLRASETAISAANRALRERLAEQKEVEQSLQHLGAEAAELRANLEARQAELARLLYARYTTEDASLLKQLLSGQKLSGGARLLNYQKHLLDAQAELIRAIHEELARSRAVETDTRAKYRELSVLAAKEKEERRRLELQTAEKRKLLGALAGQLKAQRRELENAQRDEARLARIVAELGKVLKAKRKPASPGQTPGLKVERVPEPEQDDGVFAAQKGRLRLPVRGELTERFGTPRVDSGLASKGLFIRARAGEEVRAVAKGQVVYADWLRGFGNLLILSHGGGYMTVYGNNDAVLKRPGDAVNAGDVVATVGASGGNETAGLYFEIRHQGQPFDPLPWVSLK